MKNAKRIILLVCMMIVSGAISQGCFLFKSKDSSNRLAAEASNQISGAGTLSLGETMVNEVMATLITQAGYSRAQAYALGGGALAIMDGSSNGGGGQLALSAAVDMNDIRQVAPGISGGMIKSMGSESAALDSDAKKVLAAGYITSALFSTLTGKMDKLSDADKIKLPGSIASKAIGSLTTGGVAAAKIGGGAGSIMKESVAGLGSMGFASENIIAAVGQVAKEGIGAISVNKASAATVQDAAKSIVQGAVSGLASLKESSKNETPTVTEMVGPIVSNAVGALKTVTYSAGVNTQVAVNSSAQMQSIVGGMMSGAVNGLNAAGVTSVGEMNTAVNSATSHAISGLKDAGLSTQQVTYALNDIVKQTVNSLGATSANSAQAINTITSNVAATALSSVFSMIDKNTADSKALVANATSMVSQGASSGLSDLQQSNTIKASDQQTAIQDLTKATVSGIIVASKTNSAVSADAALLSKVAEGITQGCYQSGMGSVAVNAATANVGAGAALA